MSWNSEERRKFVRIKFPLEIIIYSKNNKRILSHTENISVGGIRTILKEKLDMHSTVGLEIFGIKKDPLPCKGKVRWVLSKKELNHNKDTFFDIGIEFAEIEDKDRDIIKNLVISLLDKNL